MKKSQSKDYQIVSVGNGRWAVQPVGSNRNLRIFLSMAKAIADGRRLASNNQGRLLVKNEAGEVLFIHDFRKGK